MVGLRHLYVHDDHILHIDPPTVYNNRGCATISQLAPILIIFVPLYSVEYYLFNDIKFVILFFDSHNCLCIGHIGLCASLGYA